MTMATNAQLADVFREAKGNLAPIGSQKFICNAIKLNDFDNYRIKLEAVDIIQDRIDYEHTIEIWLRKNVDGYKDWYYEASDAKVEEQLQAYRHRWLDSLIEEFTHK